MLFKKAYDIHKQDFYREVDNFEEELKKENKSNKEYKGDIHYG